MMRFAMLVLAFTLDASPRPKGAAFGGHGLVSWASQSAPPEGTPATIPYYNLKWAKGLSLDDMKLKEVARERKDGIEIIAVQYSAFDQPYATDGGGVKVLPWRQRALLFLPPAADRVTQAVLYNGHDGITFKDDAARQYGIDVCKAFGIPVLLHGWEPDVVKALDGQGYGDTQKFMIQRLLRARIERAEDMPMDGRYLVNGLPLAKGDMVSITLLQRLAARERGMQIKEVGTVGISKEGWAHWILGAVDDRVAVVSPGGHYLESMRDTMDRYRADWNFQYPANLPHRETFLPLWKLGDWMTTTEAGKKVDRAMSPEHWAGSIRARHVVVTGDLGQHDGAFPVLAENNFLSTFAHPSWRYVRVFDGEGLCSLTSPMHRSLLPHVADLLVSTAATPGPPKVTAESSGRRIRVRARVGFQGDLQQEVLLLSIVSPERTLRLPAAAWKPLTMTPTAQAGEFESPLLPDVPAGHGITFLVVARELAVRGSLRYWRSSSSLPQEQFAVPERAGRTPSWKESP